MVMSCIGAGTIALPLLAGAALSQDRTSTPAPDAATSLAALIEKGYEVRGLSMPDHHAVNFIAQQGKSVYWCHGTNFSQVLIGKAQTIETICHPVK
jgi:hypothetical protein